MRLIGTIWVLLGIIGTALPVRLDLKAGRKITVGMLICCFYGIFFGPITLLCSVVGLYWDKPILK